MAINKDYCERPISSIGIFAALGYFIPFIIWTQFTNCVSYSSLEIVHWVISRLRSQREVLTSHLVSGRRIAHRLQFFSPVGVHWRFGGTYCLHLQYRRVRRTINQKKQASFAFPYLAQYLHCMLICVFIGRPTRIFVHLGERSLPDHSKTYTNIIITFHWIFYGRMKFEYYESSAIIFLQFYMGMKLVLWH
jgi:hypothetical protein